MKVWGFFIYNSDIYYYMKNLIRKILREDIIEYYDDDYSVH